MYLDNSGLKGQFGFPDKKCRTFFIKFMREQFHLEQLLKDRNDLEEILASVKRLENIANDIEIFVYSFGMPVHKKKMQNIYDEILFMPPLPSGFPGGSKYHEAKTRWTKNIYI
jgi:hypothetical protein